MKSPRKEIPVRIITIVGSAILGLFAIVLGIFILGAFFKLPGIAEGPGSYLVNSYGLLSIFIPIYLFFAAFTLADSMYHPSRIFITCSIVFPLITFIVGYAFIRNFDSWADKFVLFALLKKTGFSLIVVLVTIFELIIIFAVRDILFIPHEEEHIKSGSSFLDYQEPLKLPRKKPLKVVPFSLPRQPALDSAEKAVFLKNIDEDDPEISSLLEDLNLPKQKPLVSVAAFRKFEARLNKQNPPEGPVEPPALSPEPIQEIAPGCLLPFDGLLRHSHGEQYWIIDEATKESAALILRTLEECNIHAELSSIHRGPFITMVEIAAEPGVKLSHIVKCQNTIASALGLSSIRVTVTDPKKNIAGIEIPNKKRSLVYMREVLEYETQLEEKPILSLILGKDVYNETWVVDLAYLRHCLIAGVKGSGKSVFINTFIISILYQYAPEYCRIALIDTNTDHFAVYNDIPQLFAPVITETDDIKDFLRYCIAEMKRRYTCLDSCNAANIHIYNQKKETRLPFLVLFINEFEYITRSPELKEFLITLAAMGPAVGIHLMIATEQVEQVDLLEHIPGRIAFMTKDKDESRLIIEISGAESLLGKGDMLYLGMDELFPVRIQAPFVLEREVKRVVEYVKLHAPAQGGADGKS